jgi:hypothetical protein
LRNPTRVFRISENQICIEYLQTELFGGACVPSTDRHLGERRDDELMISRFMGGIDLTHKRLWALSKQKYG